MDLQKLKAFVCVAKHKSFTRASVELFISQPALSKKISDFEKELGTTLFIRDNRVVELTEAGKVLFTEAPVLLKYGDDLESKVKALGENPDKKISIGCTGIEFGRLSETMSKFHKKYPDIELIIHKYNAAEIRNMILSNMLDIAFQTRFELDNEPEVDRTIFQRDCLSLVVSKHHKLASREEAGIDDIHGEKYIGIQPTSDHIPFTRMINMLVESGYNPEGIMVAPNVDSLILSVSCGLAVGHLFSKTEKVYGGLVQYVKTKDYNLELEIDMVWNKTNRNKAKQLLINFVKNENSELGIE